MVEPLVSRDGNHRVYFGDAARMAEVPDGSVDLAVFSPPYGIGKDYSGENPPLGEAGTTPGQVESLVMDWDQYEAFLARLFRVYDEVSRTIAPGGYVCINIASIHTKGGYFHEPSSMVPTTERTALYWMDSVPGDFRYRWRYIWVAQRTRNSASGEPVTFLGSYGKHIDGVYGLPLRGQVMRMVEEILVFQRAPIDSPLSEEREARRRHPRSRLTLDEWKDSFSQVWEFQGNNQTNGDHPATYPIELPTRLIRAYSCFGDTVLDPFLGSGTTTLAAHQLGRRSIGYEVEPRFRTTIAQKCAPLFPGPLEVEW